MSLLDAIRKKFLGEAGMMQPTGQMSESTQGLLGTGGEFGGGLLGQRFNQMGDSKGGFLSNIPEEAIFGAALYSQGLQGKDPFAGAFPAFVQAAQARKLLAPKEVTQKQVFNKNTGKVEFASNAQIQASKGQLVPALPTESIVQTPGGGLQIKKSYGDGGTSGNQNNVNAANEIMNTKFAMNNVANNLFENLPKSKTGFVGESIEFLDSFSSQAKQAADTFGFAKNYEDTGSGAIDKVMKDNFNISEEAANYSKIKSAAINLAYLMARIDEPGGRFTDRDIALKMEELGFGANPERTIEVMKNAINLRNRNADFYYKTLTGLDMPTFEQMNEKKKKKDEVDQSNPFNLEF
jgi:hypothetical protein